MSDKKIAIVHDFLINYGGAESVLENFCEFYPEAPIFTLLQDEEKNKKWEGSWLGNKKIKSSFLQKFPNFLKKNKKYLLPVMPTAIETFNLRDYDLIISSSGAFSKGLVVKPKTIHVSYVHSPMRYVWDWQYEYLKEHKLKNKTKLVTRLILNYLRMWDRASASRPDYLLANSQYTAQRIKKYYRQSAKVIYPPVKVSDFSPTAKNKGYFLSVSRLSPYKRVDLLIDSFKKLKLPLIIVGDGEQRKELEEKVKNTEIKILGWVDREKLIELYQNARAFIFAAEDDFGIAPVEAMAAGKPVIALRAGGVQETVIEGITGEFFDYPEVEMLANGVRKFIENEDNYDSNKIRERAEIFSKERFKREFMEYINEITEENK